MDVDEGTPPVLDRIERALTDLLRRARKLHAHAEYPHGSLERAAYVVLCRLREQGPMRLTDLAASVDLDPSTLSRQVSSAERAGLVVREPDEHDGRARRLRLTDTGEQALAQVRAARRAALHAVLASWSPDDAEIFAELLERFGNGLDELVRKGNV